MEETTNLNKSHAPITHLSDSSDSEDTQEYYSKEEAEKMNKDMEILLKKKWEAMEVEKAKILKERRNKKKAEKRKWRDEEEKRIDNFHKLDPHFNPKLKHNRKQFKKIKADPDLLEKKLEEEKEYVPDLHFSEASMQRMTKLKEEAISLIKQHLKDTKAELLKKFFDISIPHLVEKIKYNVMTFYRLGMIRSSIQMIMRWYDVRTLDLREGDYSINKFADVVEAMCEIIEEEAKNAKVD